MYKHIIAAAKPLNERPSAQEIAPRSTRSAEPRASNASETGALPPRPLATIVIASALTAGARKPSSDVPSSEGRTPTQAPQMRGSGGDGAADRQGSSLAGMKFSAQSETTSLTGQLSGRQTVAWRPGDGVRGVAGGLIAFDRAALGRAVLGGVAGEEAWGRKIRSAG